MSYTKLEQFILLSLKDRYREAIANGNRNTPPAAGSVEELWTAVDDSYRYWDSVRPAANNKIIRDRILNVMGCTETDLRVALKFLTLEGLIKYNDAGLTFNKEKKVQPTDNHCRHLTEKGLQACRELECPV